MNEIRIEKLGKERKQIKRERERISDIKNGEKWPNGYGEESMSEKKMVQWGRVRNRERKKNE